MLQLTLMLLLLQMAQHRWISREPLSFKMRSYEALTHPLQSCQSTDLGAKAAHASCETLATLHCNDGNESRESHGPVTIAAENKHGRKSCLYQSSFPALLWNQATALPSTQPGPPFPPACAQQMQPPRCGNAQHRPITGSEPIFYLKARSHKEGIIRSCASQLQAPPLPFTPAKYPGERWPRLKHNG